MATLRHARNAIAAIAVCVAASPNVAWPDTAVGDFWNAVGSRPAAYADLRYHVRATIHVNRKPEQIEFDCYHKGADKRYLVLTEVARFPLSMRPLPPAPGTEIIVAGHDILIRNGVTREVRFSRQEDVGLGSPPIRKLRLGLEMAPVEPYIHNYMAGVSGEACESIEVTDVDEATRVIVAQFDPLLKWTEPHEIAEARWTVDRTRSVVTKFEALDGGGEVVVTTVCTAITEVAPGRWMAMAAETVVKPGEVIVVETKRGETFEVPLHVDGSRSADEYLWLDEPGLRVPKSKRVVDHRGGALLDLEFSAYEVDTGLDDSLFLINPSGQPVDGGPGGDR